MELCSPSAPILIQSLGGRDFRTRPTSFRAGELLFDDVASWLQAEQPRQSECSSSAGSLGYVPD
jgi:hypothetical protein